MAQEASIFSKHKLSELPISEWIIENCTTMGMEKATNVQWEAIPHIINGKHVVCRAKTGSGKTAAFALPILEHLSQDPYGIFAIILTPSRELACQIGDQFIALSANTGFRTAIAYGGSGYITNTGDIEDRPHILIATPGRLADLIHCGMDFDVSELKYLVIDEADQLLCNKGFNKALTTIIERLPSNKQRQTLLFSATLDKSMNEIFGVINKKDKESVVFLETSNHKLATVQNIKQSYCFVPEMAKETYLVTLCTELEEIRKNKKSVIIFISSKEYCMIMARLLKNFGLRVSELHANMKQKQRLKELCRFRGGQSNILVATDLASRGLDIPQVEFVINFDIPRSGFEYIHRIGRCGRIDRCGHAITFVSQFDIHLLQKIEQHIKSKMTEFKVKKYQKLVTERMKKVLVVRAGIINSVETKFLMDPHSFKRDPTLRWNGKFTDPRILGKVNLKHGSGNVDRERNVGETIDENKELYKDFRTAFDNEFHAKDVDERERKEQKQREDEFMNDLGKKEKKSKKKKVKRVNKEERNGDDKMEVDDDGNMYVMEEEVRLKNMDSVKRKEESQMEEIGKDYHSLPGWSSFRTGKDGKRLQRVERLERAKQFQQKRKKMELRKSKREGRQSELDIFSIYQKGPVEKKKKQKNGENENKFDRNMNKKKTSTNTKKKSKKSVDKNKNKNVMKDKKEIKKKKKSKKMKSKQKKKKKREEMKKDVTKISKSLHKKLNKKERKDFIEKKRSWFGDGDIQWT